MSKYKREFKCLVAKQCLNGLSSEVLAKQHSISSRQIRYWTQVFAIHGSRSFLPATQAATAQSKLAALKLMWTNSWSATHTSAVLNLSSPGIFTTWLKRYNEQGLQGLEPQPKGRPPMKQQPQTTTKPDSELTVEELREELAYLRAENAVLKKLEELEQEKNRRMKKKR
ncbi:helix-turn-helix domain-containing protein [Photobacterium aphoticum]|uniref:Transcriptional regulator n=1 Tax=Photobacterium aphoticum TaxID=754436 RepID=A0A0J1GLE9_9GAMM|nr:helix-turn-helix domain-containing protein [Photobacterium aphoticum]KLV00580.1 transcriptional regulator [Photobacterium aphoticum]PSU59930.1 helix-turn-helix domain-containing protein [Photobacterium aphoticum]GHA41607.1 transcriptional regulator [Photobacterium aphoticum]